MAKVRRLLRYAGYCLFRMIRAHELVPLAAEAAVDGENILACARAPEQRQGQQAA